MNERERLPRPAHILDSPFGGLHSRLVQHFSRWINTDSGRLEPRRQRIRNTAGSASKIEDCRKWNVARIVLNGLHPKVQNVGAMSTSTIVGKRNCGSVVIHQTRDCVVAGTATECHHIATARWPFPTAAQPPPRTEWQGSSWLGRARKAEVGYFGKHEIHTVTVGTCFARRIPGGVARLRRRLPNALPIWAASLSCLYSDRLCRNAVRLCGMGRQAHRVTLCTAWRTRWPRRGADLHLHIVGSATTAAV